MEIEKSEKEKEIDRLERVNALRERLSEVPAVLQLQNIFSAALVDAEEDCNRMRGAIKNFLLVWDKYPYTGSEIDLEIEVKNLRAVADMEGFDAADIGGV